MTKPMPNYVFRCPADLMAELERIAVRDERTVSQEIRRLVRMRVEAESRSPHGDDASAEAASSRAEASGIAEEAIG